MPASIRAGDVLADRYQMVDLLGETAGGWFWCAHDDVLQRMVAVHLIDADDARAPALMEAARTSASLVDRRNLRVLDADRRDGVCYVVNEWGTGESLDKMLAQDGPLPPRQAAWLVAEVADTLGVAHDLGKVHGRLVPENVLVDENGQVRIIGFAVDAALHGVEDATAAADVAGLAAVLYAALTGRWPGEQASRVPAAPRDHGHLLRPRQVRAGIPRALDGLCEQVLSEGGGSGPVGSRTGSLVLGALGQRHEHDLTTATGIRDALEAFLGDPTGGATAVGAPVPFPDLRGGEGEARDDAEAPGATVATGTPGPAGRGSVDIPTEAGMPVFHEDEDVEWLRARSHRPAPPPAFEEPAERPLFAPDPPEGAPARRPRPPRPAPSSAAEYWPWDTSTGRGGATGAGTGSGFIPVVAPDELPGRRWLRLAWIVGFAILVLLLTVAAYQLGGGGLGRADEEPADAPSTPAGEQQVEAFTGLTADDFDPQGADGNENPELAPLAVDGDPATTWRTSTYEQQFGPAGLKTGVGLTIDLGEARDVAEVSVQVVGGATELQVYVHGEPLTTTEGAQPAGAGSGGERIDVTLDEAVTGRYVTVWLTSLPQAAGGFRGEVAEVVVRG